MLPPTNSVRRGTSPRHAVTAHDPGSSDTRLASALAVAPNRTNYARPATGNGSIHDRHDRRQARRGASVTTTPAAARKKTVTQKGATQAGYQEAPASRAEITRFRAG